MKRHNTRRFKIAELEARLGCSRQTIWRWYTTGDFPQPHYLSKCRVWFEDEIEQWEHKQMSSRAAINEASRNASNKQTTQPSSAESFYTMSGSSPPDVTSSEEGGPAS